MKATLAALVLMLTLAAPVRSDVGLEAMVAEAYFPRASTAQMHQIAHARAVEIAQPGGWCHCGIRDGTAEVLAYNNGLDVVDGVIVEVDPIAKLVRQWQKSPGHHAILSNGDYGQIGCAVHFQDGNWWGACVLTWSAEPVAPPAPAAPTPAPAPPPAPSAPPAPAPPAVQAKAPEPVAPEPPVVVLPDTAMAEG